MGYMGIVKSEERIMNVVLTIEQLRNELNLYRLKEQTIGFVPTMGYLHEGHLSLVEAARKENDIVVMSIFVNPTQFGPGEDYASYPRDSERDIALAKEAGVDFIFMPSVEEMYPQKGTIQIVPGAPKNVLCGISRPTHFDGVLTVVLKLLNIVQPTNVYFGMKDAQQLAIIETFVEDFNVPTIVRRVPTVREESGLAKSSRNVNLTTTEREQASVLYKALSVGKAIFLQTKDLDETETFVKEVIKSSSKGEIDYVQLLDYPSLQPITEQTTEVLIACAVQFSKARLIDNIIFNLKDE